MLSGLGRMHEPGRRLDRRRMSSPASVHPAVARARQALSCPLPRARQTRPDRSLASVPRHARHDPHGTLHGTLDELIADDLGEGPRVLEGKLRLARKRQPRMSLGLTYLDGEAPGAGSHSNSCHSSLRKAAQRPSGARMENLVSRSAISRAGGPNPQAARSVSTTAYGLCDESTRACLRSGRGGTPAP